MMFAIRSLCRASIIALIVGGVCAPRARANEARPTPSPSPESQRGTRPGDVQKVFVLKHVDADVMREILSVFPAEISTGHQPGLQALSVSGAPAVVAAIEETVKRLDVQPPPARSVGVTAHILECSPQEAGGGNAPAELQAAIAQLKRTFGYGGCQVAETLVARAHADSGMESSERAQIEKRPDGSVYLPPPRRFFANQLDVDALQSPPLIRFRRFGYDGPDGAFSGDVEVRDGQQVVLGKLGSLETGKDRLLVFTAKLLD